MATYLVVGHRTYREHAPGETFDAQLTPGEERRALRRRDIVLLDARPTTIDPSKIRPPTKG